MRGTRTGRAAGLAGLGMAALALAGCGSSESGPDPAGAVQDDFAGGTCLVIAPDVLFLRDYSTTLLTEDPESAAIEVFDVERLAGVADRVRQGVPRSGGALRDPLERLVQAVDGVGSRLQEGTYGPPDLERVRGASQDVIRACT